MWPGRSQPRTSASHPSGSSGSSRPSGQHEDLESLPLLDSEGREEDEELAGTSEPQRAEDGQAGRKWPQVDHRRAEKLFILSSQLWNQVDQVKDGLMVVKFMEQGFPVWAVTMSLIVLIPQLLVWFFLYSNRATDMKALARILCFPCFAVAFIAVVSYLPSGGAMREVDRRWYVNHGMFFLTISAEQAYHFCSTAQSDKQDCSAWWASIGEGAIEAPCSAIFILYTQFLQNDEMDLLSVGSIVASIVCVTKTATELHLYGARERWVNKGAFAVCYTFPHVLWRLLSLAFLAYLLRPSGVSLKENRAEIFIVFFIHELTSNAKMLRFVIPEVSTSVLVFFSYMMLVFGPPLFLTGMAHARLDHHAVQFCSSLFALLVAFHMCEQRLARMEEFVENYKLLVLMWAIATPLSFVATWRMVERFQQEATDKSSGLERKLRNGAKDRDVVLVKVTRLIAKKRIEDRSWLDEGKIPVEEGASKWEGIAAAGHLLFCAPRDSGKLLVVDSSKVLPVDANKKADVDDANKKADVDEKAVAYRELPPGIKGTGLFFGIAKLGDKLYCAPYNADKVLVIESATTQMSTIALPSGTEGETKWAGIAACGKELYCAPRSADSVLVVDTIRSTTRSIELPKELRGGSAKFFGIAELDGKLYCCPRNAKKILVITPPDVVDTIDLPRDVQNIDNKWSGIAVCKGKLYCAPFSAPGVLVIDPIKRPPAMIEFKERAGGSLQWAGIVEYQGRLYCSPHMSSKLLIIDPHPQCRDGEALDMLITKEIPSESAMGGRCSGIAVSEDRRLFCCPCGEGSVLHFDPNDSFLLEDLLRDDDGQ